MWELEHIQVRALKIIFQNVSYKQALTHAGLCTVKERLKPLCTNVFTLYMSLRVSIGTIFLKDLSMPILDEMILTSVSI